MKIGIRRKEGRIEVVKDYNDIQSISEISQTILELELIKLDLMDLYQELSET